MGELLLHVGHDKTGSSYLQSVFAGSRDLLRDSGIDYPAHKSLESAARGETTSGNAPILHSALLGNQTNDLFAQCDRVLVSGEMLPMALIARAKDGRFDEFLKSCDVDSVRILLFIRNPVAHCSSVYQQTVKVNANAERIEDFFERYRTPLMVLKLLRVFAVRDNMPVMVRNYSRTDDLTAVLNEFIGTDLSWVEPPVDTVNRSLTRAELEFQRRLNAQMGPVARTVSDHLIEKLSDVPASRIMPSIEIQEKMLKRLDRAMESVNVQIDADHHYIRDVTEPSGENSLTFSPDQLDTIASALAELLPHEQKDALDPDHAHHFRAVAGAGRGPARRRRG